MADIIPLNFMRHYRVYMEGTEPQQFGELVELNADFYDPNAEPPVITRRYSDRYGDRYA